MYRGRLQRDLKIWTEKGLIEPAAAASLLAEYDARPASFSLGRVLAVMASLLVGAAVLLFVASNWQEIPRLARLSGLVVLIWASYLGAARCFVSGRPALAAALLVLGTVSFGGAMSLVAQMYNLSGDLLTMMMIWFAAGAIVAALFRSPAQVVLTGFLAWCFCGVYLWEHVDQWYGAMPWAVPVMAGIVILLARYAEAQRARHLAYLMMVGWLTWIYGQHDGLAAAVLLAAGGMIAFLAVSLPGTPLIPLVRTAGAAPAFYTFLIAAIGFFAAHAAIAGQNRAYGLVVAGIVTLAASVGAIVLGGRDNGAVRCLAYIVFACEIAYLAGETVGSIIGTSGFFLVSGVLLAVAAWLVFRLERRFHGPAGRERI